ncbi:MAG: hypothetical protein KA052_01605 [Candidatus Pacebacteria bacterium]|nr:hypothetical protein [Candidatus Paceibacterota bacterium]
MSYQKKTNLFKKIVFSRGAALLILFVIVFMGYGLYSLAGKSIDAAKERKRAEAEAATLAEKRENLSTRLSALNTPDGKEAALREQFPLVKNGEHMIVITEDENKIAPPPEEEEEGFWDFLKNIF